MVLGSWMASMKITGYTASRGRFCHSVISPITLSVIRLIVSLLTDAPDTVNKDPYGDGWLFEVELTDAGELDDLLDADAYAAIAGE